MNYTIASLTNFFLWKLTGSNFEYNLLYRDQRHFQWRNYFASDSIGYQIKLIFLLLGIPYRLQSVVDIWKFQNSYSDPRNILWYKFSIRGHNFHDFKVYQQKKNVEVWKPKLVENSGVEDGRDETHFFHIFHLSSSFIHQSAILYISCLRHTTLPARPFTHVAAIIFFPGITYNVLASFNFSLLSLFFPHIFLFRYAWLLYIWHLSFPTKFSQKFKFTDHCRVLRPFKLTDNAVKATWKWDSLDNFHFEIMGMC